MKARISGWNAPSQSGYGIAQRMRQISGEVFQIEEGTPYPALQKLLAKG
jgi:DNA-binding PadR family transcriptional regulator